MAGVKKPNQKIFQLAINKARTDFDSSIMIGDNLEAEVRWSIKCWNGCYII